MKIDGQTLTNFAKTKLLKGERLSLLDPMSYS